MLKDLIFTKEGQVTDTEFKTALEWATMDIKNNKLNLKQKTSLDYVIGAIHTSLIVNKRCGGDCA